jgi:hypothetical protein
LPQLLLAGVLLFMNLQISRGGALSLRMSSAPSALSALVDGLDGYHTAPVRRAACDADFARVCPASSDFIPLPIFLNHCGGELGLTFKGGSNIGCTLPRCAHEACLSVTQSRSMCKNTCVSPPPPLHFCNT